MASPGSMEAEGFPASQNSINSHSDLPDPLTRRSGRARNPPMRYNEDSESEHDSDYEPAGPPASKKPKLEKAANGKPSRKTADRTRKKPPEASNATAEQHDIVAESLAPMSAEERGSWDSWIELESEPSFFTAILAELGVKNVKIMELFSLDAESLKLLPEPVHGLIFLYEYFDEELDEEEGESSGQVWFANQTTDNACATVAMLNIVMNAGSIELGEKLTEFKESTKALDPALRGYLLSCNNFLQAAHNSFARRIDLLNAALVLENDFELHQKQSKSRSRAAKKRLLKTKPDSSSAFHFIAYVQADNKIWELDGLQTKPRCLGPCPEEPGDDDDNGESDWTAVAAPFIQQRMAQLEAESMRVNLLALCRNPLRALLHELHVNVHKTMLLDDVLPAAGLLPAGHSTIGSGGEVTFLPPYAQWVPLFLEPPGWTEEAATQFLSRPRAEQDPVLDAILTRQYVDEHIVPDDYAHDLAAFAETATLAGCNVRARRLRDEWDVLYARYGEEKRRAEMEAGDDEARAEGRRQDCTLVIHDWLRRLALAGALEEVFEASQ